MPHKDYHLQVGKAGEQRLNLLNSIYNTSSFKFLESLRLDQFKSALEVGSGTGDLTIWIAEHIHKDGILYSIDQSAQQLEICRKKMQQKQINNIRLKQMNVLEIDQLPIRFDFIYCRWLLVHIPNYKEVVEKLFSLLNPGGVLVCEDGVIGACSCNPVNQYFEQWKDNIANAFKIDGRDFWFGNKLLNLFQHVEAKNIIVNEFQPILNKEEKDVIKLSIVETKNYFMQKNILKSEKEYLNLLNGVRELENDQYIIKHILNKTVAGFKL